MWKSLFLLLLAPIPCSAEEVAFFVQTTYATGEVPVSPSVPKPSTTTGGGSGGGASPSGLRMEGLSTIKVTPASGTVPVKLPSEATSSSVSSSYSSQSVENIEEQLVPEQDSLAPTSIYTPKPIPVLEPDILTDELLQLYEDTVGDNVEKQQIELADGISVTQGVSGPTLAPEQRVFILSKPVRTVKQLRMFAKALVESDPNIRKFEISDEHVVISYRQKAKLFGLFPVGYILNTKATLDGQLFVQKPWWLALASDGVALYAAETRKQIDAEGGDMQRADMDLQNTMQKQQQIMQMMSSMSKMLHDTGMAIIRKIE